MTAALVSEGCATGRAPRPHSGVERYWNQFVKMPSERALVLAGDPNNLWVAGASGGHETREQAEESAHRQCLERRAARRLRAPCRLYAVGNEIVW